MPGERAADGTEPDSAEGRIDDELQKAVGSTRALAYLILYNGDNPGWIYVVTRNVVILGRDDGADIRLTDASVSAHHARIVCRGSSFEIEDLSSTNGTFVEGQRITRSALRTGDRLAVGAVELQFLLDRPTSATMQLPDFTRRPTLVSSVPALLGQPIGQANSSALTHIPQPMRPTDFFNPHSVRHQSSDEDAAPSSDDMTLADLIHRLAAGYRFLRERLWLIAIVALIGTGLGLASIAVMPPALSASSEVKLQPRLTLVPVQGEDRWQNTEADSGTFVRDSERALLQPELVRTTLLKLQPTPPTDADITAAIRGMKVEEMGDHLFRLTFKDKLRYSPSPVAFLNLHLHAFVQAEINKSVRELKAKVDFLSDQLKSVETDMTRIGSERANFRVQNSDRLPEDSSMTETSRHALETKRADLMTLINQLQGQLHAEQEQLQQDQPMAQSKFHAAESYRTSLAELNRKLSEAYARGLTDAHPEIQQLMDERKRIEALSKDELQSETSALARDTDPNFIAARHQVDKLSADLAAARANLTETERSLGHIRDLEHDLPRVENQLSEMDHRQTATKQLHSDLFTKMKQAEIQLNLEKVSAESRYDITPPALESPRRVVTLVTRGALGWFGGLMLAAFLILLREAQLLMRRTLTPTPSSMSSMHSGSASMLHRRGGRRDSRP